MEIEEIEELYTAESEKAKKEFLDGLDKKKDTKSLELNYKEHLKQAREKYFKLILECSKNNKKKLDKISFAKINKKEKRGKVNVFRANTQGTDISSFERERLKSELYLFRFKLKIKKLFDRIYYPHLSLFVIRTNKSIKNLIAKLKKLTKEIFSGMKESFLKGIESINNITKKIKKPKEEKKQDSKPGDSVKPKEQADQKS